MASLSGSVAGAVWAAAQAGVDAAYQQRKKHPHRSLLMKTAQSVAKHGSVVRKRTDVCAWADYSHCVSYRKHNFTRVPGGAMSNTVAPQIIQRIRAEYLEMPGLSLRPEQVQRLCGVDSTAL